MTDKTDSKERANFEYRASRDGVAESDPVSFTAEHVAYINRYGGRCRDCADESGICPNRGLPCVDAPKAIQFVLDALAYGINHGYIASPTTQPAPQQEAQEPCPTCIALARTVMLDQVSFDRKPDCYGIRQITDDESVEEWEDIRTSQDVAREEADDMMATGRGEIYEVVPLWTTPQPSPASQGDALDAARYRLVRRGQHWSVINGIGNGLRAEELDAAVDAARKQGGQHGAE